MPSRTTTAPSSRRTTTAGPSPASWAEMSRPHTAQREVTLSTPSYTLPRPQRGQRQPSAAVSSGTAGKRSSLTPLSRRPGSLAGGRAAAPPVDADEEEEPDDVDEMPVPGRRLEAEMVVRLEMAEIGPE